MEYRLGNKNDLNDIVELIRGAVSLMESQGIYQWDEIYPAPYDFEEDINNQTLYVACDEGKIAAIYVISRECDEAYNNCQWTGNDEDAYILHRFCVCADYQNRGIGRMVLCHVEDQIKSMGYKTIRLDVFTKNPYALRLYERNGYEQRGYADWRKGRFYLMEKAIDK